MYKIQRDPFDGSENVILRKSDRAFIPKGSGNIDYDQFVRDVKEQGLGIVEGASVTEESYIDLRKKEYPSLVDQQDMQYWDAVNGTTTWKDKIASIKAKYPKGQYPVGVTNVVSLPTWVEELTTS
tara:strand:- start:5614 stop:5988 length:375 start_codon:yes stop_codon:yes gene_type:complete